MSSTVQTVTPTDDRNEGLHQRLDTLGLEEALVSREQRRRALERFVRLPSGREKPGRFWRVDFESVAPTPHAVASTANVTAEGGGPGLIVTDLRSAAASHSALLARAFGTTGVGATKFGSLTTAFVNDGIFIYVPADRACDDPIVIRCEATDSHAIFPWNVVLAERGARVTVIEHLTGGAGTFVCGATEIVTAENAEVTYAAIQKTDAGSRVLSQRFARPGRDAAIAWASAELGADLTASDLKVLIDAPGAHASITSLFFPAATQHVDVISTVEHRAGDATSETIVKSAALERGQARFLGNIRIARHAQGSDARLRDDALLLSRQAHVDSVPALEIGANDVKAYHGATVGAIDPEQIFYMESRGIERQAAERIIALGFFEPAIERFPTTALRDEIRGALAAKLA